MSEMTLKEVENILLKIYRKEGQPALVMDTGGYKGDMGYFMTIGGGRIKTEAYPSIEELLKATKEYQ